MITLAHRVVRAESLLVWQCFSLTESDWRESMSTSNPSVMSC